MISCAYDTTITSAILSAINENDGYVAVASVVGDTGPPLIDNETGYPVPLVKLAVDPANDQIYGALASYNSATNRVGVIRTGIVPFKRDGGTSAFGDIGLGVDAAAAGNVAPAAVKEGRGTTVARSGGVVFVDLDVDPNPLS